MTKDIMLESKQMVWDIKEHLKKWVEKNKTETNYIAMTPIENFIRQIKRGNIKNAGTQTLDNSGRSESPIKE